MQPIAVEGLAVPFFVSAETPERERFSAIAFRQFVRNDDAKRAPICVAHQAALPLPVAGAVEWTIKPEGLAVSFSFDADKPAGRSAALAVAHGHCRLSICPLIHASERRRSHSGEWHTLVRDAEVVELSLVSEPAFRGTFIKIAGRPLPSVRSMPSDAADRQSLLAFLGRMGAKSPDFMPTLDAELFQRSKPTPSASSSAKPIGDPLKPFRNADLSLAELSSIKVSGKTLYQHMTAEERGNALDQLLDSEPKPKRKTH